MRDGAEGIPQRWVLSSGDVGRRMRYGDVVSAMRDGRGTTKPPATTTGVQPARSRARARPAQARPRGSINRHPR